MMRMNRKKHERAQNEVDKSSRETKMMPVFVTVEDFSSARARKN
jgi:hypothetical protein